jgi:hypothetical protein
MSIYIYMEKSTKISLRKHVQFIQRFIEITCEYDLGKTTKLNSVYTKYLQWVTLVRGVQTEPIGRTTFYSLFKEELLVFEKKENELVFVGIRKLMT